jgi:GT2 family glycosyltransferase
MNITFIITNFNNYLITRSAVESIFKFKADNSCLIIVIDNASNAENINALHDLEQEFKSLVVIYNRENLGYFSGLNVGIAFLKENFPENLLQCIVIGNNDLFFDGDFFSNVHLANIHFKTYPVIAPDILRIDGVHQNPHVLDNIGPLRLFLISLYYSNYLIARLMLVVANMTRRYTGRNRSIDHRIAGIINQGYGACYLLGPLFFKYFDELWSPSFLMCEEYFLSHQLHNKNLDIYYEPRIVVNHHDHATVRSIPSKLLWGYGRHSFKLCKTLLQLQ